MAAGYNRWLGHSAGRRRERFPQGIQAGPVYPQSKLLGCALSKFWVNSVVVEVHNHSFSNSYNTALAGLDNLVMTSLGD